MQIRTWKGPMLLLLLILPPVYTWLESTMTGHMLIQIPFIIIAGYWIGGELNQRIPSLDLYVGGIPGLILIIFTLLFWMIPRSLDHALTSDLMELAKFASLTLFVGVPLGIGWHKLGFVARGFVWIHLISMVFLMGWLYASSPIRVCNQYLIDQQRLAGWLLLGAGVSIVVYHLVMMVYSALSEEDEQVYTEGIDFNG
jgi:Na+/citrate or Na+/malate symporter